MTPTVYYIYDAYCGWCYGFSPVIKKLYDEYKHSLAFDVLSGGMILPEKPSHISVTAEFIKEAYPKVEEMTGIKFGRDFLWHINNPNDSDWYLDSEKSAIALCIFKEIYPERSVEFAVDLEYALNYEGRDLCDDEAYRHLLAKYEIDEADFYANLKDETYKELAYYEFDLVKQLGINGFPCVLLQVGETKFYALANGFVDYETLKERLENVLKEVSAQ